MDCDEFLEGYSSFLDQRVGPDRRAEFVDHMDGCDSCTRYDRVVRRGLEVVHDLPDAEPSPDFLPRLRHRIYHLKDNIPFQESGGGSALVVAAAAVGFLALAWMPFASRMPVEVELQPVAVERPEVERTEEIPSLFEPGPFLDDAAPSASSGPGSVWLQGTGAAAGSPLAPPASFLAITRGAPTDGR